jgi:uncharacterized repeat protein (TIGR03803 family)
MKLFFVALFAGLMGYGFAHTIAAADTPQFSEKVLYSFRGAPDGGEPYASVIAVRGVLYGTTYAGGTYNCDAACGTVFALDLNTGAEKLLYAFDGTDGANPEASLTDVKGTFYGTASGDGITAGTVFSFERKTNTLKTLYSFCSLSKCADGTNPAGGVIYVNGTLYGTTLRGGTGTACGNYDGCGTVFSVDPHTGIEKVIYSFCGKPRIYQECADGVFPAASLISVNGTLYGTSMRGGRIGCGGLGCGTVFSLDPSTGTEKVLYHFCSEQNCADGAEPHASVIDVNGTLYGTTYRGGSATECNEGCGTVFSVDPTSGVEKVLYSFCSQKTCADGANPLANLIHVNGTLYGTTFMGGGAGCGSGGCGTVFSIDPTTGAEKVIYAFQNNGIDGTAPQGGLIDINGTLYGTTVSGGAYRYYGTVFALKQKR